MSGQIAVPDRDQCYALGKTLAPRLEPVVGWNEIASQLGVTRERAYKIGVTALGRLAFHIRQNMPMEAFDD